MAEKPFSEMSLDEVFDLERQGAFHVGRSVVTASGVTRRQVLAGGGGARMSGRRQGSYKLATSIQSKSQSALKSHGGAQFHVVTDGNQWGLRKATRQRAVFVSHAKTKQSAVSEAVRYLKNHGGGSLQIHNRDGSVQEERTFPRTNAARSRGRVTVPV